MFIKSNSQIYMQCILFGTKHTNTALKGQKEPHIIINMVIKFINSGKAKAYSLIEAVKLCCASSLQFVLATYFHQNEGYQN